MCKYKRKESEGGTVFTGDDDPQLIADALPFTLKTYESLLEALPEDDNLLLATGKAFCMYGYAFLQTPADTISDTRIDEKNKHYLRAKRLHLRGYNYLRRALEVRHPGFNAFLDSDKTDSALALTTVEDTTLIYWTGAALMCAYFLIRPLFNVYMYPIITHHIRVVCVNKPSRSFCDFNLVIQSIALRRISIDSRL